MKRLALVVTWLAVTVGATVLAWTIVSQLTSSLAGRGPRTLTPAGVQEARHSSTTTTAALAPAAPAVPGATQPGASVGGLDSASGPATTTSTTASSPPVTPPTTGRPATVPGPPPPPTTSTSSPARSAVINAIGGVATVDCGSTGIRLLSSSPRNGYTESVETESEQIEIKYRSSSHTSEIQATCVNGQVQSHVSESSGSG